MGCKPHANLGRVMNAKGAKGRKEFFSMSVLQAEQYAESSCERRAAILS
jgi:hypothetical protein